MTYLEYSACCIKAALGVTYCLDSNPDETVKTETADVDPTEPRPDPVWYLPYAGTVCVDGYDVPKVRAGRMSDHHFLFAHILSLVSSHTT